MSVTPQQAYIAKAEAALTGARLLLQSGDVDGACSRAYYAMFDAAHAALVVVGIETANTPVKSHSGLIALFGQHLVLTGRMASAYGEAINQVQRFRQLADYSGDPVSLENARWSVEQAEAFLATVRAKFISASAE